MSARVACISTSRNNIALSNTNGKMCVHLRCQNSVFNHVVVSAKDPYGSQIKIHETIGDA